MFPSGCQVLKCCFIVDVDQIVRGLEVRVPIVQSVPDIKQANFRYSSIQFVSVWSGGVGGIRVPVLV